MHLSTPPVNITALPLSRQGHNYGTAAGKAACINSAAMAKLTEAIRENFRKSGVSVRKLHLATGLPRATIANFRDGQAVHSDTLDTIADYLGLTVTAHSAKETKPKK